MVQSFLVWDLLHNNEIRNEAWHLKKWIESCHTEIQLTQVTYALIL